MRTSLRYCRAALTLCAVIALLGAALAPLRVDAASKPSFFGRVGQWMRSVLVRARIVRPASSTPALNTPNAPPASPTPSPTPVAPMPALPEGWKIDRSPLRIPAGTPAAEREAIERAYRILGGVPVDPRGTYNPNVGPLGQPIPSRNRSPEEERAIDAATDAAIKRGMEMLKKRSVPSE